MPPATVVGTASARAIMTNVAGTDRFRWPRPPRPMMGPVGHTLPPVRGAGDNRATHNPADGRDVPDDGSLVDGRTDASDPVFVR